MKHSRISFTHRIKTQKQGEQVMQTNLLTFEHVDFESAVALLESLGFTLTQSLTILGAN